MRQLAPGLPLPSLSGLSILNPVISLHDGDIIRVATDIAYALVY